MKKKYILMAVTVLMMAITFSGCYVERYPHYHPYHPYHHGYYRY